MKGVSFKTVLSDHVPVDGNGCIWLIWNMSLTWFCFTLNVEIVKCSAWRFSGKDSITFSRYYLFLVFSFFLPVSGFFLTRDIGMRCVCRKASNSISVQQRFSCCVSSNFSYCRQLFSWFISTFWAWKKFSLSRDVFVFSLLWSHWPYLGESFGDLVSRLLPTSPLEVRLCMLKVLHVSYALF